jgi:hypothetical protein
MTSGKAHGQDRDYQVLCRDILQKISVLSQLKAYSGDGIDVTFSDLGGTNITFDVALKDSDGNPVVVECRRRDDPVKQEALFAFAHKVELLRRKVGLPVAGVFCTKRKYQIGAVKHAEWTGIQVITLPQSQSTQHFVLAYQKYDAQREKRLQKAIGHFIGSITPTGSLSLVRIRKDGTSEDFGQVG